MRRRRQGQFATFAMLIPMFAIPVMAVFGIPQFAPVVASPADKSQPEWLADRSFTRIGQSDAFPTRSLNLVAAEADRLDLFEPYPETVDSGVRSLAAAERQPDLQHNTTGLSGGRRVNIQNAAPAATPVLDLFEPVGDARTANLETAQLTPRSLPGTSSREFAASSEALESRDASASLPASQHRMSNTRIARQPVGSSWRDAIDRLNQLGIRTYRLSPSSVAGGYHFWCQVTSVDAPQVSRRFEAESREPLDAVDRVLAQVEEWNRVR